MSDPSRPPARRDVSGFLTEAARTPAPRGTEATPEEARARVLFALDATASRQPTWDLACALQGEMFRAGAAVGGLALKLCFYRGFREFRASRWLTDGDRLERAMTRVRCAAGRTQIGRVLRHGLDESRQGPVRALIFVGDCMEEEPDHLCDLAGQLGLIGTPLFVFHEGRDRRARTTFREMARLSGGVCTAFDPAAADRLRQLLAGVAVFAAGGRAALEDYSRHHRDAAVLLEDLRPDGTET